MNKSVRETRGDHAAENIACGSVGTYYEAARMTDVPKKDCVRSTRLCGARSGSLQLLANFLSMVSIDTSDTQGLVWGELELTRLPLECHNVYTSIKITFTS